MDNFSFITLAWLFYIIISEFREKRNSLVALCIFREYMGLLLLCQLNIPVCIMCLCNQFTQHSFCFVFGLHTSIFNNIVNCSISLYGLNLYFFKKYNTRNIYMLEYDIRIVYIFGFGHVLNQILRCSYPFICFS